MVLFRRFLALLVVLIVPQVVAQPRMHPNMGMVPHTATAEAIPHAQTSSASGDKRFGYGAFNRFTLGRTDYGTIDTGDTPPYAVTNLRVGLSLSYYAGAYIPNRGTSAFDGSLYALTGGPNAGGSVPGLYKLEPDTGIETRVGDADPDFPTFGWTGMAFDITTDRLVALATDCAGTTKLYEAEAPFTLLEFKATLTGSTICPINLMIDGEGRRYSLDVGLTGTNDFIYQIRGDYSTEALPNDAGFDAGFAQGGGHNPEDNLMYLAAIRVNFEPFQGAPEGELRTLDLDGTGQPTGATTLLGPFADDGNIEGNFLSFPFPSTVATEAAVPDGYELSEAYPNPFNPSAVLTLRLTETQHVRATLHDALGRQVAVLHDGVLASGPSHPLRVAASDLPSGSYAVYVVGERFAEVRRVTLVR